MYRSLGFFQSSLERDSDSTKKIFQHCLPIPVFLFNFFSSCFLNWLVTHKRHRRSIFSPFSFAVSTLSCDRMLFRGERADEHVNRDNEVCVTFISLIWVDRSAIKKTSLLTFLSLDLFKLN